jgi:esterase/lipase superfamily enzyme
MLRTFGRTFAWLTAVCASCLVMAQEPAAPRKAPRVKLPKTLEKIAPELRGAVPHTRESERAFTEEPSKVTDRIRDAAKGRVRKATPEAGPTLAELGASAPFGYSARRRYLVAAVQDDIGLALWETATRKRVRELEDSNRAYALVAISEDARWIAGVRQDESDQIDLWRADNGRHVRVIHADGGPKTKLEFESGNQLRVVDAQGDGIVINIPSGVVAGGSGSGQGGAAVRRPGLHMDASPRGAMPTAPSTTRAAPPRLSRDLELPALVQPAPRTEMRKEPRIPEVPLPRIAPPPSLRSMRRAPSQAPAAPPVIAAPAVETDLPSFAPAPSPSDEPTAAAPEAPAAGATDEPDAAAPDESLSAAPSEQAAPESAFAPPSDPAGGTAPGLAAPTESGEAAAETDTTSQPFHFEMGETPPMTPGSPAPVATGGPTGEAGPSVEEPRAAAAPTPLTVGEPAPTSVNIHYATNRNRLAPKDREWLVYFCGFFASLPAFVIYALVILALLVFPWFGKRSWAASAVLIGSLGLCSMGLLEAYVRSQLRDQLSGELYGCRATDLSYGNCEISVPPSANRRPGDLSRPVSVWIFEAPENPEKHFMLRHVEEHKDKDAFYRSLSARLDKSEARAAMLFIHGYNVSFEDAIFRTAQLAVDLKFPGAAMAFSWPSYADPVKYTFDEQNAEVSIPALREVLEDLAARSGAKRVHIIAHSMGNRVLAGALGSMDSTVQARNKAVFRELVLAAPDIDSRVFQSQVLPHIVRNVQHCTLYASSRDRALLMSRCFHNYQRLGETQPELLIDSELDTIDASLVDTSLLGHSYIGDVQSIVSDLHDLVVGGKWAIERLGLETIHRNALEYWSIKPEVQAAADGALRR